MNLPGSHSTRFPRDAVGFLCFFCVLFCTGPFQPFARADDEFFEKQIRPILVEHCQSCHGDKEQEASLRLTSRDSLLHGGDTGPAIVPGKPDESLLIAAVSYLNEPKMPPEQKLADADIEKLKQWVTMGAPWPNSKESPAPPTTDAFHPSVKQKAWWAYQPVQNSLPPSVQDPNWPLNEIDFFIAAASEARGLKPVPAADRATWLRRATFDLIGLPPTPQEIDAFLADDSDQAYEHVVDRLLESPAYGQRWARHWLDVVRYADYHDGDPKARDMTCEPMQAWRYRDWVVDSFNRDLPFDEFIVHQIAGDLLPSPDGRDFYADGLVATTFLSNGSWDRGDADKEKMVSDMVDDNIDTIGKAFMGLTLGCARCHDHKFDPISNEDYYALAGVFYSTRILKDLGSKGGNYFLHRVPLADKAYVAKRDEQLRVLNEAKAKLTELDKRSPKPGNDDPERMQLNMEVAKLQSELLTEPGYAESATEGGTPGSLFPGIQDVPIHIRGSYTRLGAVVPRHMPVFFAGDKQSPITNGSGRREVAAWVASRDNPLTARVIVNRVWQWHFGEGIVKTPNNFGLLSEPPSHPELLDWLAARFVEDGWSLKKLHRRIMLSATYRLASVAASDTLTTDPENRWLARFTPQRLEAESIRDAMLFVTGKLDATAGGPANDDVSIPRRSLYVQTARWDRSNFATLFDAANPDASDEKRNVSTVAPQSLFLLNNPFTKTQATAFIERLKSDVPDDAPDVLRSRTERAYRLLFGRVPRDAEREVAQKLITANDETGWFDLAHVLFCSNEFVYVD